MLSPADVHDGRERRFFAGVLAGAVRELAREERRTQDEQWHAGPPLKAARVPSG